jgi:hypothetical protein
MNDAAILREVFRRDVTARETCRCGAVFETTTRLQSERDGELRDFRRAHEVCRRV